MNKAFVILAAGIGSRMKSDLPKVLHPLGGAPMLIHAMKTAAAAGAERIVIVTGHGRDRVEEAARAFDPDVTFAHQPEQRGTANAVDAARDQLADFDGDVFVLFGDTPFVSADTLDRLAAARVASDVVILGFAPADPGKYGRLVMDGDRLTRIVEFKDATDDERQIGLCNGGVMVAERRTLFDLIGRITDDNAQNEFYLTDVVELAGKAGLRSGVITCPEAETLGINARSDLAFAEQVFQNGRRSEAMENGVTLVAPDTVFFAHDTVIGRDALIEPHVVFGPGATVESTATIRAFSHIEGAHIAAGCVVGPYARLRPGAELADGSRIGNFVEVKNATIGEEAKVNHLSYVGDATVGDGANIGAGTITCNYDGVMKHHTDIGPGAFIGSNTALVAPVSIGRDAMTGSGSVITQNVPEGAMAIARARQENKPGLAVRLRERLTALKAKRKKG